LSDPEKTIHKAYGAWGLKKNYGREYEGTIRSTFIISPDGMVVSKWHNVKVRSKRKGEVVKHADIVREKLAGLKNT
jgi:peroxiredoxin Q/BCP